MKLAFRWMVKHEPGTTHAVEAVVVAVDAADPDRRRYVARWWWHRGVAQTRTELSDGRGDAACSAAFPEACDFEEEEENDFEPDDEDLDACRAVWRELDELVERSDADGDDLGESRLLVARQDVDGVVTSVGWDASLILRTS